MLIDFFTRLRGAGIPVSVTEYLSLLAVLDRQLAGYSVDDFYVLSRTALVKDERYFDRFDKVFDGCFKGLEELLQSLEAGPAQRQLRLLLELQLSDDDRRLLDQEDGWNALLRALAGQPSEDKDQSGAGEDDDADDGDNPQGDVSGFGSRRAVKVWQRREFRNLDDSVELGTRNLKLALRRLRRFARAGAAEELDLDGTIRATARNAGLLDIKLVPERHNAVKVLLFLDVGGSMDDHVQLCGELFSAARSEFRHLEYFYFHNCPYETLWRDNRRRHGQRLPTLEVIRTYGRDYRLIFVGDATMNPDELRLPGGSVEHYNDEAGEVWLRRLLAAWPHAVWLNPQPDAWWQYLPSVQQLRQLLDGRMYPLTLEGLERAMRALQRGSS